SVGAKEEDFDAQLARELLRFTAIWDSVAQHVGAIVVQNNFEAPSEHVLGSMEAVSSAGRARFAAALNEQLARAASTRKRVYVNDLAGIAADLGLRAFLDPRRWFSYKLLTTPSGSLEMARSLAAIVRAVYGRSRKCLVLDLDNTLWGGVIGDDG